MNLNTLSALVIIDPHNSFLRHSDVYTFGIVAV